MAYDVFFSKGVIYASVGVKAGIELHTYDSGTPKKCVTIKGHLYARIGMDVSVLGQSIPIEPYDIYNESNSPVRVVNHYEDDVAVGSCSRGHSLKYVTSPSSYYYNPSSPYGSGSYGGGGTVAPVVIWEYEVEDGNATITKYNGTASAVVIPSTLDGYTVTKIGDYAFRNNTSIRSVTMSNNVIEIGWNTFNGCSNLSSISLPTNIVKIGATAFSGCKSLTEIYIPKTLNDCFNAFHGSGIVTAEFENGRTAVPYGIFRNSTNLKNVTIPDTVITIGDSAFQSCTSLETLRIPEYVTEIGWNAFEGCSNLSGISLPPNIVKIGGTAFSGCKSLTEIYIPKTLNDCFNAFHGSGIVTAEFENGRTAVPYGIFRNSTNLKNVTIPDTVITIGENAFQSCTSLETLRIPEYVTEIGGNAFEGCSNLSGVSLPPNIVKIGGTAFSGCKAFTEIYIPKTLSDCFNAFYGSGIVTAELERGRTTIPYGIFRNSANLKNITIPNTVTYIDRLAFESCTSLETIYLPNSITKIEEKAFIECTSLKSISIPDSVTEMGIYIFSGCKSLEKAKIPVIRQNIMKGMFENCSSLKEIELPNTVTTIQGYAFSGCTALENIKLPDSLTKIEDGAFKDCTTLTAINIPEGVTSIGSSTFENCDSLTEVSININGSIGSRAFYDCDGLAAIRLGDGVTSIGSSMCYGCDSLSDISFGKYIETIPDSSFRLCQSLTSVTLPRFCTTVAANAFAEDTKLMDIYAPVTVSKIENNSFSYPAKMTMHGKSGTYAQEYAGARNMNFSAETKPITSIAYGDKNISISRYAKVRPALNIAPEFDTSVVKFSSSDESVLTVSSTGEVYGKNYGTARITATTDSGRSDSIDITVLKTVTSISLSENTLEIKKGGTGVLTATVKPSDAADILTWSSSNPDVATVDNNGNITALSVGTAVITVTASYSKVSASCTVTVFSQPEVTGVYRKGYGWILCGRLNGGGYSRRSDRMDLAHTAAEIIC